MSGSGLHAMPGKIRLSGLALGHALVGSNDAILDLSGLVWRQDVQGDEKDSESFYERYPFTIRIDNHTTTFANEDAAISVSEIPNR